MKVSAYRSTADIVRVDRTDTTDTDGPIKVSLFALWLVTWPVRVLTGAEHYACAPLQLLIETTTDVAEADV